MSAINERVSPETLDKIIEAADEVITALAGTNEDVHKNDSDKMCQLWDDLNDRYATPAIVKAMARELQQYRAAAEKPIGSFHIIDQQVDGTTDYVKDGEWPIDNGELLVYAAPQVTSVPDDAFERALSVLNDTLDDCSDSERGLLLALDRMGIEVEGAAPAVQAEQLSGNTEQVEPVSDANKLGGWIPVSERMPDTMISVLVTGDWFHHGVSFWDGASWCDLDFEPPVTHWMPLPAAPQQEAQEAKK